MFHTVSVTHLDEKRDADAHLAELQGSLNKLDTKIPP